MLQQIVHLLVSALSVLLASKLVPGIRVKSYGSALVFALALAILNLLLWHVLVLLALPLILLTFGLFLLVLNGFLFWLADKVVDGVEVQGFGSAMLGALVTGVISFGMTFLLGV